MDDNVQKALISHDYGRVIKLLSARIKADPNNALDHQYLAFAHYKIYDLDAARQYCETATRLDPNLSLTWLVLSYLSYIQEKDSKKCMEFAQKAYNLDPTHSEVLACWGFANLLEGGDELAAVQFLEKAVSKDPLIWEAWNNLSIAYARLGKRRKVLRATWELFRRRPSPRTGMKLLISLMALPEARMISIAALFVSIILSIWFQSSTFLLFLVIYALLMLLASLYASHQKAVKEGAMGTVASLLLFLLAWLLNAWIQISGT